MDSRFLINCENRKVRIAQIKTEIEKLVANDVASVTTDLLRVEMYWLMADQGFGTWVSAKA
jgi:hypothetical protein